MKTTMLQMPDYCQIRVSLGNAEAIAGGERRERE
jgi:hypothetical protein